MSKKLKNKAKKRHLVPWTDKPLSPIPPLIRVRKEGCGGVCVICGSTLEYRVSFLMFEFGRVLGCHNKKCMNSYKRLSFWKIQYPAGG